MSTVHVVGGGPAGLSAAIFTAKNGLETAVSDTDGTWMHKAHLFNYPGIGSVDGSALTETMRNQAEHLDVDLRRDEHVESVERAGDGFTITTESGEESANYVVLATGANRDLAEDAGCAFDGDVVDVDVTMETSVDGLYATGAMVRAEEWQAVISAGDGAAAALNILSAERGDHFHDFDTPADADELFGSLVEE
ncbi:FAD-dependent oxidoreductase [Halovivax cerinus]|uniref:FAD-dependent oxidoreductase n=1 Tax=Halovivax cerinus TaxID=1487865 RepID=A0ABD5NJX6_9EURY|nr:FAD-dependent oxidoreductase [Halovivax cerinus]